MNIKFVERTKIEKGWSGDKKYCAVAEDEKKYLLRIAPLAKYERLTREFEMTKRIAEMGVPMSEPIEIGTCDEGVYVIQTWIDGVDAEEKMVNLTQKEQYEYGVQAGVALKKMHGIPAPEGIEDWDVMFNRKMDRKIQLYQECPLKYENGQAFIDYINQNRHLIKGRPQTYQHGDYHVGNMMIENTGKLMIVDFDRDDYGDPWEEFNRIVWCVQASPRFASGMVDGYFDYEVPMEFWKLLALYISSNTLSSLPWAMNFGEEQIRIMENQAKQVLEWYENMQNVIPNWYKPYPANTRVAPEAKVCVEMEKRQNF